MRLTEVLEAEIHTRQAAISSISVDDSDFSAEELSWLAGRSYDHGSRAARSLAKQLLRELLEVRSGSAPAAKDITIRSAGAPPRVLCRQLPEILHIKLSLAHSATHAACALLLEER